MRRMIPENQQEAVRKLAAKEAILGLIVLSNNNGVDVSNMTVDSDGFTYLHVSGKAILEDSEDVYFDIKNIPEGLYTAGDYIATNNNGGAESVSVTVTGTTATISFNTGEAGRTVYFSILLSKTFLKI